MNDMKCITSVKNPKIVRLLDAEALLVIYAPYVEQTAITFEYDVPTVDARSSVGGTT